MRKEVEDFLARQEEEERKKREAYLISLGLYEAIPLEEGAHYDPNLHCYENGQTVRKIALELTEEEYAAVCAAAPEKKREKEWPVWPVHKMLVVLAILIYVRGGIIALTAGITGISIFFTAVLYGTGVLALSEIVRLMKKRVGE